MTKFAVANIGPANRLLNFLKVAQDEIKINFSCGTQSESWTISEFTTHRLIMNRDGNEERIRWKYKALSW